MQLATCTMRCPANLYHVCFAHGDRIHRGRKGHKNQFWVYVKVYQQLTKPGRPDSAVAKPKFMTVKIFPAV